MDLVLSIAGRHVALGCSDEVGYTITRQTRVESVGKHGKGFIYTGSNNRGITKAALNHVSKLVPKNEYMFIGVYSIHKPEAGYR